MTLRKSISLQSLESRIARCAKCPRLRSFCQAVAGEKRRAFIEHTYWGKPVPGFGDPAARFWIIGLAPAAHGANRTGRVFTGDRSGDFLFAALHRAGFANQSISTHAKDGLRLKDVYISAAVRCAPPGNKPLPEEIANCSGYLDEEWNLLANCRVLLALGSIGWNAALTLSRRHGCNPGPAPFGHGAKVILNNRRSLLGSYHVSQQNTFTGKLTTAMFDRVLEEAIRATP
jgi:uracil-DNA glycosylase family 4